MGNFMSFMLLLYECKRWYHYQLSHLEFTCERKADQSLNKADDCLGLGLESRFARIDKRDLQMCDEEKDSQIGWDRFIQSGLGNCKPDSCSIAFGIKIYWPAGISLTRNSSIRMTTFWSIGLSLAAKGYNTFRPKCHMCICVAHTYSIILMCCRIYTKYKFIHFVRTPGQCEQRGIELKYALISFFKRK